MSTTKYFAAIAAAQAKSAEAWSGPLQPFNFAVLVPQSAAARLATKLMLPVLLGHYRLSRRFLPVFRLFGALHLSRDAQVREVLSRPDDFTTPFGPEMAELRQMRPDFTPDFCDWTPFLDPRWNHALKQGLNLAGA